MILWADISQNISIQKHKVVFLESVLRKSSASCKDGYKFLISWQGFWNPVFNVTHVPGPGRLLTSHPHGCQKLENLSKCFELHSTLSSGFRARQSTQQGQSGKRKLLYLLVTSVLLFKDRGTCFFLLEKHSNIDTEEDRIIKFSLSCLLTLWIFCCFSFYEDCLIHLLCYSKISFHPHILPHVSFF